MVYFQCAVPILLLALYRQTINNVYVICYKYSMVFVNGLWVEVRLGIALGGLGGKVGVVR